MAADSPVAVDLQAVAAVALPVAAVVRVQSCDCYRVAAAKLSVPADAFLPVCPPFCRLGESDLFQPVKGAGRPQRLLDTLVADRDTDYSLSAIRNGAPGTDGVPSAGDNNLRNGNNTNGRS